MDKSHHDEKFDTHPRLLFAIAIPLIANQNGVKCELNSVDYVEERNYILRALDESKKKIYFCTEIATPTKLMKQLSIGASILHLSGHGNQDWVAFEGEEGCIQYLTNEKFRNLFSSGGIKTKVVFVSSCYSEMAGRKVVEAGVPHVIAVKVDHRLQEKTSWTFAEIFYFNIFNGKTVRQAYDLAVHTVAAEIGTTDASTIYLLLPEDSPHDEVIFQDIPTGHYVDDTIALGKNYCDRPVHQFIGRKVPMQAIYKYFGSFKNRIVTIIGERGIGKTALANEICHYMNERRLFDIIYFIPLSLEYCYNILATHFNNKPSSTSINHSNNASCDTTNQSIDKNILAIILAVSISNNENVDANIEGIKNINDLLTFLNRKATNKLASSRILFVLDGLDSLFPTYYNSSLHVDEVNNINSSCSSSSSSNGKNISSDCSENKNNVINNDIDTNHEKMLISAILDTFNAILNQTKSVSFLTTSTFSLTNDDRTIESAAEKVVILNPLDDLQSAKLLGSRSPRELTMRETEGAVNHEQLSKNHIFSLLEGNPRAIVKFASSLNINTLDSQESINYAKKIRNEMKKKVELQSPRSTIFTQLRGTENNFVPNSNTTRPILSNSSPTNTGSPSNTASNSSENVLSLKEQLTTATIGDNTNRVDITTPPPSTAVISRSCSSSSGDNNANASALSPVTSLSSLTFNDTIDQTTSSNSNSNLANIPIAQAVPISINRSLNRSFEATVSCTSTNQLLSPLPPPPPPLLPLSPPMVDAILVNQLPEINDTKAIWAMLLSQQAASNNYNNNNNYNNYNNNNNNNNNSNDIISWSQLISYLSIQLQKHIDEEDRSLEGRSMTSNDKEFLKSVLTEIQHKNRSRSNRSSSSSSNDNNGLMISESLFKSFYSWWTLTLTTITSRVIRSEFFTRRTVTLIHGFISRNSAENMLLNKASGAETQGLFIIRFSESSPGSLAISFTDKKKDTRELSVTHTLIRISNNGSNIYHDNDSGKSFQSLSALVLQRNKFMILYPNINKNDVFSLNQYEVI